MRKIPNPFRQYFYHLTVRQEFCQFSFDISATSQQTVVYIVDVVEISKIGWAQNSNDHTNAVYCQETFSLGLSSSLKKFLCGLVTIKILFYPFRVGIVGTPLQCMKGWRDFLLYRRSRYRQTSNAVISHCFLRRVKKKNEVKCQTVVQLAAVFPRFLIEYSPCISVNILWNHRHFIGTSFCLACHLCPNNIKYPDMHYPV